MAYRQVSLSRVLAGCGDVCSPRTAGQLSGYDLRVAHAKGERGWHSRDHAGEFCCVIAGRFAAVLREAGGTGPAVELSAGDIFAVPGGVEHKPSSPGAAIVMFEPSANALRRPDL